MKYDIRVGDYVETKDGKVGYITSLESYFDTKVAFSFSNYGMKTEGHFYGDCFKLPQYFNRVGRYDFTKKDKGKLEPLEYNGSPDWDDSLLLDKINELVEAVNRLEEKVNN